MRTFQYSLKLLLLSFLVVTFPSFSQSEEEEEMIELSLEDLMNITVKSATKSDISIQKAPSVVRVFNAKDFETFGYTTLQDVLNAVPGLQVQEYRAGHQLAWVRGVQARYNNKVLLLIDGEPSRDAYYGNFNVDEMIPLSKVEKIEVLNGPGSVLYGANSFSGVINITTKDKGRSAQVAYGSFNTTEAFVEFDKKGLYVSGKFLYSDGFEPEYMSNGVFRDVDQTRQLVTGSIKYSIKDFSINASMTNYEYPYRYRSTDKEYRFTRTPITAGLNYTPELTDNSSLKISAFLNQFGFEREKTKFVDDMSSELKEHSINDLDTRIIGSEINYYLNLDKHQLILGASWQQDVAVDMKEVIDFHVDGPAELGTFEVLTDPDISRSTVGLYVQNSFELSEILLLTGGLRYDIINVYDNQFNYRVGITGQKENLYGKLLYGTAFRVPSYREYLDIEAPNALLEPEHLNTLEFQVGYVNKYMDISLTLYNNNYNDFIQELFVDSIRVGGTFVEIDDEMAFNFDSRNITGLELNVISSIMENIHLHTGLHVYLKKNETLGSLDPNVFTSETIILDEKDLTFLSNLSGFVNLSYQFKERYVIGLNNLFSGSRNTPLSYQTDIPANVVNASNTDGYLKMDLFVRASILPENKLVLSAKLNNLLDSKIYSPPYGGNSGYDIEWTGRTFRLGLGYNF